MNQKKSLIEAASLKKKAQADDQVIKREVDEIRNNILTLHKRGGSTASKTTNSRHIEGDYGAYEWATSK